MTKKIILAVACCLPLAVVAQKGFNLRGTVNGSNAPAKAVLVYEDNGKAVVDSTVTHQGQFNFTGQVKYPATSFLYILRDPNTRYMAGERLRLDLDHLQFWLENSNIQIAIKDTVQLAEVKGSATQEEAITFTAMNLATLKLQDSISRTVRKLTPEERKDVNIGKRLRGLQLSMVHSEDSVERAFSFKYPDAFYTLVFFKQKNLAYNFNPDTAAARFTRLSEKLRKSPAGIDVERMITNAKNTGLGSNAIDFTESDPSGKKISLSDFRGHYVLLDFWASWCAPCRAENPNYLKAYNTYKDKNFTILGVSMDSPNARGAWINAIKQDNLPWTQISELKGFSAKSAHLYSIVAIPTNFLIDPSGKIIGKNLRGQELLNALAKTLK